MNNTPENINLVDLLNTESLSERAANVCKNVGMLSLKDILEYYYHNGTFIKLRNCGKKTNNELIKVCKKYENIHKNFLQTNEFDNKNIEEDELKNIIENLNISQKTIISIVAKSFSGKLSNRAYNALSKYLNNNFSIENIYDLIIGNKNFKVQNIKNVGTSTIPEIENFINELYEYIQLISLYTNEKDLQFEYYKAVLTKYFPQLDIRNFENFIDSEGQIKLFNLIRQLFEKMFILNKQELKIFKSFFAYFNDIKHKNIPEIASDLNVSRERVRQILKAIYGKIYSNLTFISTIYVDMEASYNINAHADIINIKQEIVDKINSKENTNYNKLFITKIISIYLKETHNLVGNEKDIVFNRIQKSQNNWKWTYIISKDLTKKFNFEKFAGDIFKRLSKRINETYRFHFQNYLLNFYKTEYENIDRIATVCESLIYSEFDLILDKDYNIVFEKNTNKQKHDIAREILEEAQEPLNIKDIYNRIIEKYPNYQLSISAIATAIRENENFIYFGRQSTYGLKIWEQMYPEIKGGTIRDITEEFLNKFDKPKHIKEITKYVIQYRNTNEKNIYTNLTAEGNNRFTHFKGNYFGLKKFNKYYNYQNNYNFRIWEKNYRLLKKFVNTNGKYPRFNGNKTEKKLAQFCSNNRHRWKKGKLTSQQIELLKSINFNFKGKK